MRGSRHGLLLLVLVTLLLTSCLPAQLMGEGPPPGYVGGGIPASYRGRSSPFPPTEQSALSAGAPLYEASCARCHGDRGLGDGTLAPYLEPRPANFATPGMLEAFRRHEDYVFWWVSEGVAQTSMPAWKDRLDETERWQVIAYSRSLAEESARTGARSAAPNTGAGSYRR